MIFNQSKMRTTAIDEVLSNCLGKRTFVYKNIFH